MCVRDRVSHLTLPCYEGSSTMRRPIGMALFGMVWLLRVRSEMKRCAKCRREQREKQLEQQQRTPASCSTFFTIDAPTVLHSTETLLTPERLGPTTYCEVHGFNPPKEDIQEFYELTLLDENKSVQEKTAETIRIANKWETNDGPIIPTYTNNEYILCICLVALTSREISGSGLPHAHLLASAPVIDTSIDPNPAYSFAYDVQDALTGDSKGHVESRANGIVKGQYSVADPDGTRRIVDYYADLVHGFNAVVRRVPLGVAIAPVAAKVVAPVAPVAPVAQFAPAVSVARALPPLPAPVSPAVPFSAPAFPHLSPLLTRPATAPVAPGPAYLPAAPAPYWAAPPLPSGLRSFVTPYAAGPAPLAVGTGVAAPYLSAPALW